MCLYPPDNWVPVLVTLGMDDGKEISFIMGSEDLPKDHQTQRMKAAKDFLYQYSLGWVHSPLRDALPHVKRIWWGKTVRKPPPLQAYWDPYIESKAFPVQDDLPITDLFDARGQQQ